MEAQAEYGSPEPKMGRPPISFPSLTQLDEENNALETQLAELEEMLSPVLEPLGPDDSMAVPEEAPFNELHNAVLRLGRLNSRLASVKRRIRL